MTSLAEHRGHDQMATTDAEARALTERRYQKMRPLAGSRTPIDPTGLPPGPGWPAIFQSIGLLRFRHQFVPWAHRRYGDAFIPLQQLAVATGFGALAPSHLVIHPVLGPWFALRAVVLLDAEPPPAAPPIAKPCTCSDTCPAALATALAARGPESWRAWLAVRDACSLRAARYSDEQIRYHYLKVWRPG